MRARRILLALAALVLLLPVAGWLAARSYLDGDALKVRVADAVRRATGRELVIAGPIRLAWSLVPTLEARDVSFANPPGLSRPAMARLERIEARVALWPLLSRRVEVRSLVLVQPDILLERDAAGHPNWVFPPPPPAAPSAAPAAPSASARMEVVVQRVEVRDGRLGWRHGAATTEALLPHFAVAPETGRVSGEVVVNGEVLAITGSAGPAGAGWPVDLNIAGGGLSATLKGTGAQAAVQIAIPNLAALFALAGRPLPPVHDVLVSAMLSPAGVSDVHVQAGESALPAGLRLVRLSASAPSMDQPVAIAAEAAFGTLPLTVAVQLGSPAAALGGGPVPVKLSVAAADATFALEGQVADWRGRGLDMQVAARAPDLQRLGALAGIALPAVKDAALDARVSEAPGGAGWAVRALRVATQQGDVGGDVVVGLAPRPFVRGSLVSQRLDLDAWAAAATPAPAAPAGTPPPAAPLPSAPPDHVLPDAPLPFATLRRADADVRLAVNEVVARNASYRGIEARVLLQDGKLRLDPVQLQGPGGAMQGQFLADATAEPPTAAIVLRAPGLAAGPALAAFGAAESGGTIDLDVQLRGAGASLRALAATLDGHVGAAMVDGEIENRWLTQLFGEALRVANLSVEPGGRSHVRCLAIRADAAAGQLAVRALVLDATRLKLEGEGGVDLVHETLDLHLRPLLRLGGTNVAVPLRLGGTLRAPKAALDSGALAPGRVGLTIGGSPGADACGPALALARDGRAGSAPTGAADPARAKPADLLRSLLR